MKEEFHALFCETDLKRVIALQQMVCRFNGTILEKAYEQRLSTYKSSIAMRIWRSDAVMQRYKSIRRDAA